MKLFIFMLEKRKAFLHIFFCSLYFVALFVLNWRLDGIAPMIAVTLLITGAAGISIAYVMRYILILWFTRQWKHSLLLLTANFLLMGLAGYIVFHGFESRLSNEVVGSTIERPWREYIRFYISWYAVFAKYGVLFFLLEGGIFSALDGILSRYWPNYVPNPERRGDIYSNELEVGKRNKLVGHFLNNLMSRVYSQLMSRKRMKTKQVIHLASLVDYGQLTYHRSPQQLVPLQKELVAVRHFLAMEEACDDIHLTVRGDIHSAEVPSMLLPSIAKNIVKHGAITKKGKARMDVWIEGSSLYITSENKLADTPNWQQPGGGYGLKHIRCLLKELFGKRATFWTGIMDEHFRLYIKIDKVKRSGDE
ncbi:LytS family sensor histidine kinase [Sphingobacterium chuzhouense]|uniref:Signal transduction histidine kinase internal region domain-containing protein n=1 Tax=Sphingobacterium chuzhouense TaxID=1742264 RepID=A0ABR7XUT7_9SPHI|nr:hypothetical protein [Sphingobacterium chuzhouense]MBD1422792.1 hypothetical protein [Sphingobacterium chuzhouense]